VILSSVLAGEDVLEEEPEPRWRLLFGEDLAHGREDVINGVQAEHRVSCPMSSASRGRAASAFMARRCSGEAAKTRRPGWSNTLDAAESPPGAT